MELQTDANEMDFLAIRYSAAVVADDAAFAALMARATGTSGPRLVTEGGANAVSLHGDEGASL